jgi:hypothetical protein
MERWIGSYRRKLLDQTLIWNQRHLLQILREYEAHHNGHRPHRSLGQAAPLRPLPAPVTDLDSLRVRRHQRSAPSSANTRSRHDPDAAFGTHRI